MTISMTASPARPLPRRDVQLTLEATTGNYFKLLCTSAPPGSELQKQLDTKAATRVPVLEGDTGRPYVFRPDRGGVFTFVVQELTKGASTYGGGYQGATDTHPSETIIGETTVTLTVGQRLTCRIGLPPDTATLVLFVWGDTIRKTTRQEHGEASPAIIEPASDRAKWAIEVPAVQTALAALVDMTAAAALGSFAAVTTALVDAFTAHLSHAGHAAPDTYNALDSSYRNPGTSHGFQLILPAIQRHIDRHTRTDHGGYLDTGPDPDEWIPAGTGTGDWHAPSGSVVADWTNLPAQTSASGQTEALMILADLWHSYEEHRQSTAVHTTADTTNDAGTLPALLELFRTFIAETRSGSPTVPSTANSGAMLLMQVGAVEVVP